MKLGFLLGNVRFGGGELILQTLMNEFHSLENEIYIYSWNKDWISQKAILPYTILVLDNPPIGIGGKLSAFKNLRRALQINQPDCLIIFSLALAEIGTFSAKSLNIPTLLSERVDPTFLPKSWIHRIMKKVTFSFADKIVFHTEEVKKYFSKRIQKKGVIIQNMIMNENFSIKRPSETKKEIIAAGRLSEEKNYQMLINGFAHTNLVDYKLRILGEGPYREKLQKLILSLNMQDKIILEGEVKNVMPYFAKGDIFVITSNHEGMPNTLIEAMVSGMACISTDFSSGGARALIQNRIDGILIPVDDISALKEALLFLVNNPSAKEEIKTNALAIRFKNSKKEIMPHWVELIKSLDKSKGVTSMR